jgi:hypothetical protein
VGSELAIFAVPVILIKDDMMVAHGDRMPLMPLLGIDLLDLAAGGPL